MSKTYGRGGAIQFQELVFARLVDSEQVVRSVVGVLCDPTAPRLVVELRGQAGRLRYLLGAEPGVHCGIAKTLGAAVLSVEADREPVGAARRVVIRNRERSLDTDHLEATTTAILAALTAAGLGEELVLQIVVGPRLPAMVVSPTAESPVQLRGLLTGGGQRLDAEARAALVHKLGSPGARVLVRLGVSAPAPARRQHLALGVLGALRQLAAPGVSVSLESASLSKLDTPVWPWRWPTTLNAAELAAISALPVGRGDLPGLPPAHPRLLAPAQGVFPVSSS